MVMILILALKVSRNALTFYYFMKFSKHSWQWFTNGTLASIKHLLLSAQQPSVKQGILWILHIEWNKATAIYSSLKATCSDLYLIDWSAGFANLGSATDPSLMVSDARHQGEWLLEIPLTASMGIELDGKGTGISVVRHCSCRRSHTRRSRVRKAHNKSPEPIDSTLRQLVLSAAERRSTGLEVQLSTAEKQEQTWHTQSHGQPHGTIVSCLNPQRSKPRSPYAISRGSSPHDILYPNDK